MFWKNSSGRLKTAPRRPARRSFPLSKGAVASPTALAATPATRFAAPKTGRITTTSSVKKTKTESREFRQ